MAIKDMFRDFFQNLKIDNSDKISNRYDEITASLNKKFRDTESKKTNSLQVGSYGRWTAIKGISDLDMLYIMPKRKWDYYKNGKQSQLLSDVCSAIKARYPATDVRVNRLVVTVTYKNFHIEVQPVFEQADGSFKYPDTYNGGSWKITKPREEIAAMTEFCREKNNNLRNLCRMARAWKNKHGVCMGGLLIDTLAYNFLKSTDCYDDKGLLYYNYMSRDFFKYLSMLSNQDRFAALGSGQHVKVKKQFQSQAKKAYELCLKAIDEGDDSHNEWKKVYGHLFPSTTVARAAADTFESSSTWHNTEQFVEDLFQIDIRYSLILDCEVSQRGYREYFLKDMLERKLPLLINKKLLFTVSDIQVPDPYQLKWKVLNQGSEAEKRNCIRGQIFDDDGFKRLNESTSFKGDHIVECYAIKNGIVVAQDRIHVPIQ